VSGGPSHPGCTRRLARTASRTVRWRSDCGSAAWSAGWCPTALVRRFRGWPDCPRGHRQQRQAPPPTIIGRWGDGQQDDQEFGVDRNRQKPWAAQRSAHAFIISYAVVPGTKRNPLALLFCSVRSFRLELRWAVSMVWKEVLERPQRGLWGTSKISCGWHELTAPLPSSTELTHEKGKYDYG